MTTHGCSWKIVPCTNRTSQPSIHHIRPTEWVPFLGSYSRVHQLSLKIILLQQVLLSNSTHLARNPCGVFKKLAPCRVHCLYLWVHWPVASTPNVNNVQLATSFTSPYFHLLPLVVIQSLSCVKLFANPWIAACQAYLSFTISWSLLKFMSIKSVMPTNHLISVILLTSCLQSFPELGSFPMSQLFASGGQSIGASASVLLSCYL